VVGLLLGLLLAPVLALLAASPSQAAETMCLPSETSGCIAGTLRTEEGPVSGASLTVTSPSGETTEIETGESGRWNISVEEEGAYQVTLDEDSLPDDVVATTTEVTVQAGFARTAPALFEVRTGAYDASSSKVDELVQGAASGLRLGLLLALASVGLSLIYGTTGLSNFAHAEQVTLGGILGYVFVNQMGLPLVVGGLVVVAVCATTGWLQDRVLWQPLRRRGLGLTQLMIVTIGLSLALQYVFQFFVGARTVRVEMATPTVHQIGPITLSNFSYVAMGISVVVLAAVGFALQRTRIGRATRAVSDNPALASASGIDVDKVIRLVWTVAMGLAGLSGLLYALAVGNGIKWDTGLQILLLLFAAVTLGGLGTAFGALIGSLVIGMVVEVSPVLGMPGDFKYATALIILILLLLVRPQGLLGKAQRIG
jgi:branched-chain amino acid transport system permease protein